MALETLQAACDTAARLYGRETQELEDMSPIVVHKLGEYVIGNHRGNGYRVVCGQEHTVAKGGERMAAFRSNELAIKTAKELALEMWYKVLAGGFSQFRGGKGVTNLPAHLMTFEERALARQLIAQRQAECGIGDPRYNSGAGDMGTNGLSDIAALAYKEAVPGDSLWQASVTGKSPELGGLEFRPAATGYGGFIAQRTLIEKLTPTATDTEIFPTTVQGFGNVGSWYAHFASTEYPNTPIMAISDADGIVRTQDPRGLIITEEMVRTIGDNPAFTGKKIEALAKMLEAHGQMVDYLKGKPNELIEIPTTHLVLAAGGDVINAQNVSKLGLLNNENLPSTAIIELANGPLTPEAQAVLTERGVMVLPDFIANGAGVACSIEEYSTNIGMAQNTLSVPPSTEDIKKPLGTSMAGLVIGTAAMARLIRQEGHSTHLDMRAGAAAISIGRMLKRHNLPVPSELERLLTV